MPALSSENFLRILLGAAVGLVVGLGSYTFLYARGDAYLSDNPAACNNCHVMAPQYNGWARSSHRSVATCNDCHTPAGFFGKYYTKATNGFWHSFYFTTGLYPDNIHAGKTSRAVVEGACLKCHQDISHAINTPHDNGQQISCVRCHVGVGHMEND